MDIMGKILTLETHMTQKQLAQKLGVSAATIRNWKKRGTVPKKENAQKINRVYGTNKRHMSNDTIEKAASKIREYDVRQSFEIQKISAGRFAAVIEDNYARHQFLQKHGHMTGFYTYAPERCIWMEGEMTELELQRGIYQLKLIGVIKAFIATDDASSYQYLNSTIVTKDISSPMDIEQALQYTEDIFYSLQIPNKKAKQNHVPYQFLGFQILNRRTRKKKK